MPKVESGAKAIQDLNPDVKVVKFEERVTSQNVERIFRDFDVIVLPFRERSVPELVRSGARARKAAVGSGES